MTIQKDSVWLILLQHRSLDFRSPFNIKIYKFISLGWRYSTSFSTRLTVDKFFSNLHKKWSFPIRISLINVTKFSGNCRFGHIHFRKSLMENFIFLVQWYFLVRKLCKNRLNAVTQRASVIVCWPLSTCLDKTNIS